MNSEEYFKMFYKVWKPASTNLISTLLLANSLSNPTEDDNYAMASGMFNNLIQTAMSFIFNIKCKCEKSMTQDMKKVLDTFLEACNDLSYLVTL